MHVCLSTFLDGFSLCFLPSFFSTGNPRFVTLTYSLLNVCLDPELYYIVLRKTEDSRKGWLLESGEDGWG